MGQDQSEVEQGGETAGYEVTIGDGMVPELINWSVALGYHGVWDDSV